MSIWKHLPAAALVDRLEPPQGRISMVLDTDTYNEVDDQFALAYALLSPETLNVQAIYAAPFLNTRSTSAADGMEKSHAEILRLLDVMNRDLPVFKGSTGFLPASDTPVDSPAARDLVQRALAMPDDELLYVVAIGAITNVASALLMEPRIAHKIVIVWLGGNAPGYPSAKEFNLDQDKHAARVVFDCGAPLTLIPCFGVTSHLLASVPELQAHIGGKNTLCDALIELFAAYEHSHPNWSKEIWDIGAIAYLIQPDWMPSILMHSPLITDDAHWGHDETRHLIRIAYFCKRNMVFDDLYQKLSSL